MNEGKRMYQLATKLYPIYRSITGSGVRDTINIIREYVDSDAHFSNYSIPSGKKVFDWIVPQEWEIRDAYIEDSCGKRVLSFSDNCLHVLGYSEAVDDWVDLEELKKHIYTQEDQPDVIPYITSYYDRRYGFCMSENQKRRLKPDKYHIVIDSSFFDGYMEMADFVFPGTEKDEVLFSTYCCHPSMANDNCSGMALAAELARFISGLEDRRYTYRFVFIPETIGAIAYLSYGNNLEHIKRHNIAGFTLSCVGDDGDYSVISSKWANGLSDRVIDTVLSYYKPEGCKYTKYSYLSRGSDERQYNSPGVDLSVVGFCRSKYWDFPEYHTSLDDLSFISSKGLQGSFDVMKKVIEALEYNKRYLSTTPCEPQLGRRGLYPTIGKKNTYADSAIIVDFLAYADGKHDLLDICNVINRSTDVVIPIINTLMEQHLLTVV